MITAQATANTNHSSAGRPAVTLWRRNNSRTLVALACVVVLSACGSSPYPPPPSGTAATPVANNTADALLAQAEAAPPAQASQLWLQAAEALAAEARPADAALARVNQTELSESETFDYTALKAELALARYDSATAKALFAQLQPLSPSQDTRYQRLAGELQALNDDPAVAASALMTAAPPLGRGAALERNNQIWALISQTSAPQVTQLANTTSGIERSWWQLKVELLGAFTVADALSLIHI